MEASLKSLLEVFRAAERFAIPEFQRPYCWTLEEVEQLWNDLYEAWQEALPTIEAGKDPEDYFLGPIVVARHGQGLAMVASVVDGQQRLTTLQALLWVVRGRLAPGTDHVGEVRAVVDSLVRMPAGRTKLAVACGDQANFLALQEDSCLDETRELGRSGSYLRKKVAEFTTADELARFVEFVLGEVSLILVQTESYGAAWDLFIGLNGKGRPLNAADLIKAFVCGSSADGSQMADIWQDKVLPLGGDGTSALLEVTRVATGDPGSEAKLFRLFSRAWDATRITGPLMADGAATYQRLWRTPVEALGEMDSSTRRRVRGLRTLDRRDHTSLILALATLNGSDVVFDPSLVRALEAYQLAMAIRGKRGRERDFTSLAHKIFQDRPGLADGKARLRDLLRRLAPPRDEVRAAIMAASYPGRHMKFIVLQYEEGMRGDVQITHVDYEHMMPQTPTPFWHAAADATDANLYARIANNIGNIVPLDPATNIVGSNEDWNTKRSLYQKNVPTWLACQVGVENPDGWTPANIKARAEKIADWAVNERWNLEHALSSLKGGCWPDRSRVSSECALKGVGADAANGVAVRS
jgi:hypothetical protein